MFYFVFQLIYFLFFFTFLDKLYGISRRAKHIFAFPLLVASKPPARAH